MKIAIIGSRNLEVGNLEKYLPDNVTEIVSGGAIGIDTCAENFAKQNGIKLTAFKPEYEKYGRGAPLKRNLQYFLLGKTFNSETVNIPLTFFLVSSSAVLVVGLLNAFRMPACIRYKTKQ